jgi:hypothetical protein
VEINRPEVVADVAAEFAGYEEALVAGDVDRLAGYFWDDEEVVRFGIADHQAGARELRRWRATQPPLPPDRRLVDTRVTTFGTDFAVVTTRFSYPGSGAPGRQSQTWARLPGGWRIVSAHVSEPAGGARLDELGEGIDTYRQSSRKAVETPDRCTSIDSRT